MNTNVDLLVIEEYKASTSTFVTLLDKVMSHNQWNLKFYNSV